MTMGEAAAPCLMRSVSQPLFASREFKEEDPLRALTTSISFGRFMTEPLDWEKWSSFSHNRTQEDVKKHSRPGAVAEKKAFFEAYFNKFASKKPPKKENKPPNYSSQTNVSPVTPKYQSPTAATDENMCNRGAEPQILSNQYVSSPSTNLGFSEKPYVDNIISNSGQIEQEKTSPIVSSNRGVKLDVSPLANLVFPETRNADDIISSTNQVEHEKPSTNLVLSEKGNVDDTILSSGQMEHEQPSTNLVFSEKGNVDDIISSDGRTEHEKTSTENISSQNHRFQVKVDNNKKAQIKDKISGQIKSQISWVRSSSRKAPIPDIHPKNQIFKHDPKASSVNRVKKNTQALPASANKRSKPLLDRLVNGNKTVVLKSHSTNHSEALITSTKKPRSITVPSAFSFKSDERAAKRKMFFQKLEEKPKLKEKARSDDKRLRWSTAIEAKPSAIETKRPSNNIQKIIQVQPTRRCPQKLGMKPKNFIEINKKKLSSSMACLSKE